MIPSAAAAISEMRSTAFGRSIFAMIFIGCDVRAVMKSRTSATSSGRWTNEIATQSGFFVIAYSKSSLSFCVKTDVAISVSGKLNPRRDQISSPRTTVATILLFATLSTVISILPSFNRILSPGFNDFITSVSGNWTRVASPGVGSSSNVNF